MKNLLHVINYFLWTMIPPLFIFILSFVFNFSYWEAVHVPVVAVIYFVYCLVMLCAYGAAASTSEDNSFKFF
jgi:hypothetical protein